jgi:hypothetical protein
VLQSGFIGGPSQPPTRPVFMGGINEDPVYFLNQLDVFLNNWSAFPASQLPEAEQSFKGSALTWFRGFYFKFGNYQGLKVEFLKRFWSENIQDSIRTKIRNGPFYDQQTDGSKSDYYLNLLTKNNQLDRPYDQRTFIQLISKHFNLEIRLATAGLSDTSEVLNIITEIKRRPENYYNRYNNNTNNGTNMGKNNYINNNNTSGNRRFAQQPRQHQENTANSRGIQIVEVDSEEASNFNEVLLEDNVARDSNVSNVIVDSQELIEEESVKIIVGSSPRIQLKIGGKSCEALLDSGSEVSLNTPKLYDLLKAEKLVLSEVPSRKLTMVGPFTNSKKTTASKKFLSKVKISSIELIVLFVLADLKEENLMILGTTFQ